MNSFTYETQGTNTYLVYELNPEDVLDTMSLGMLTSNKIPGIASTTFTQMDTSKYIKFNISAKIPVSQFFSVPVTRRRLVGVLSGILDALLAAEDYMLDPNTILLNLEYIFADVSTCETVLICCPLIKADDRNTDYLNFFKTLIFNTQFDQTENCDYVAKIINYLNSNPIFSLIDFKGMIDGLKQNAFVSNERKQPSQTVQTVQPRVAEQKVMQQPVATQTVKQQSSVVPQQPIKQPLEMQIPAQPEAHRQEVSVSAEKSGEKSMSMLYLLRNYSKENAALYKAQKAAKKADQEPSEKKKDKKKSKKEKESVQQGFAVPGASNNDMGFAVPGQSVSTPMPAAQPVVKPAVQSVPASATPVQPKVNPMPIQQPVYVPRSVPQGQAMNFGETTVLGGGGIGETTVLKAAQTPTQIIAPHLIRSKNNEKISLNKPVFRVGKEKSYVDYFIGDNTAISRSHANFIIREGEYLVVDTNSTNHTFVNGVMIQSNVETSISHGDKVRMANEDFEFRLY